MLGVPTREASPVSRELPGPGRYRHFKGGEYEVLKLARHSETEEVLVLYRSVDDPGTLWVRPLDMFNELVEGPNGLLPRFELRAAGEPPRRLGLLRQLARGLDRIARRFGPRSRSASRRTGSGFVEA
jgi:hypothetical protein